MNTAQKQAFVPQDQIAGQVLAQVIIGGDSYQLVVDEPYVTAFARLASDPETVLKTVGIREYGDYVFTWKDDSRQTSVVAPHTVLALVANGF